MEKYKVGTVIILGRPNVGKSTLLNNLIGHKVAAVSDKPQTTTDSIHAYFEEERGQIFFLDTPGLYQKQSESQLKKLSSLAKNADVIMYLVDAHRPLGHEDQLLWAQIQAIRLPVVLVFTKTDIGDFPYKDKYLQLISADVESIIEVSSINKTHLEGLKDILFNLLNIGKRISTVDNIPVPILSHDSKEYLAELIKEKIYTYTSQEVPYQTQVLVTHVNNSLEDNTLTVKGHIKVSQERYKPMLIGKGGQMIKKIGQSVRQELELATNKHVNIKLMVTT